MPSCFKCGAPLQVNEEGVAPVLCDRCAGVATKRAGRTVSTGTMRDFPVTSAITAINVAVFIGTLVASGTFYKPDPILLIKWGSCFGPFALAGEYWRFLTGVFLHGDVLHIAFNSWCLWSLGKLSERLFGRISTLAIYLLTGIGGYLASVASNADKNSVGASGAIFGLAGAILIGVKFGDLAISAGEKRAIFSSLVFFVVINLYLGSQVGVVDNMAHLGGCVSGVIIGLPLASSLTSSKSTNNTIKLGVIVISCVLLAAAGRELVQIHGSASRLEAANIELDPRFANYPKAITFLEREISAEPDDAAAYLLLSKLYAATGQIEKAKAAYDKAVQINPDIKNSNQLNP